MEESAGAIGRYIVGECGATGECDYLRADVQ